MARHCVWSETMTLRMVFKSNGDASTVINEQEANRIKQEEPDLVEGIFECEAINGMDLLQRYKVRNKYNEEISLSVDNQDIQRNSDNKIEIDFISLDVEGSEVEFLKCFPFDKYDVKIWTIEINKGEEPIDEIMLHYGYMKLQYLTFFQYRLDAVYVKQQYKEIRLPWSEEKEEWWTKYARCTSK